MKTTAYVFLGAVLAILLISFVAANDPNQNGIKPDGANQVADEKYYGKGGRGGGWGGGEGGWGGCRWGCCGGGYRGGCGRCCYTAQEALAYMQNEATP